MALLSSHHTCIDASNFSLWENSYSLAGGNFQLASSQPEQFTTFGSLETPLNYPTAPGLSSSPIPQIVPKPVTNTKRHMSTDMFDSGNTHKRRKPSYASHVANGISIPQSECSNQKTKISFGPDFSKKSESESAETLFPCPFYVRDPTNYSTKAHQACACIGWKINRLKEHIIRRHYSPLQRCCRCFKSFKDSAELFKHLQQANPCEKQQPLQSDFERIDELQMSQLRTKMRGKSDLEKWKEIYRIVFRLDQSAVTPSPYTRNCLVGSTNDSLQDFGDFLNDQFHSSADEMAKSEIQACLRLLTTFKKSRSAIAIDASTSDTLSLTNDSPGCTNTPHSQFEANTQLEVNQLENQGTAAVSDSNTYLLDDFQGPWHNPVISDGTGSFPELISSLV